MAKGQNQRAGQLHTAVAVAIVLAIIGASLLETFQALYAPRAVDNVKIPIARARLVDSDDDSQSVRVDVNSMRGSYAVGAVVSGPVSSPEYVLTNLAAVQDRQDEHRNETVGMSTGVGAGGSTGGSTGACEVHAYEVDPTTPMTTPIAGTRNYLVAGLRERPDGAMACLQSDEQLATMTSGDEQGKRFLMRGAWLALKFVGWLA